MTNAFGLHVTPHLRRPQPDNLRTTKFECSVISVRHSSNEDGNLLSKNAQPSVYGTFAHNIA